METYRRRIAEILETADLETVSAKRIRKQLEQEFHVDLSADKKDVEALVLQLYQERVTAGTAEHSPPQSRKIANAVKLGKQKDMEAKKLVETDHALAVQLQQQEESSSKEGRLRRAASTTTTKSSRKRKSRATVSDDEDVAGESGAAKKRQTGFSRPLQLSEDLARICGGNDKLSRGEVVKQVWQYVKEHELQDPSDRRFILPDDLMRPVFPVQRLSGFQMSKYTEKHLTPIPISAQEQEELDRERQERKARATEKKLDKKPPNPNSVFMRPVLLSPQLQEVLGGVPELPRPMVIKKLWEYIKEHNLQDPVDKRFILCDAKLRPILGNLSRISSFKMNTYLSEHMTKKEKHEVLVANEDLVEEDEEDEGAEVVSSPSKKESQSNSEEEEDASMTTDSEQETELTTEEATSSQ